MVVCLDLTVNGLRGLERTRFTVVAVAVTERPCTVTLSGATKTVPTRKDINIKVVTEA